MSSTHLLAHNLSITIIKMESDEAAFSADGD